MQRGRRNEVNEEGRQEIETPGGWGLKRLTLGSSAIEEAEEEEEEEAALNFFLFCRNGQ